MSEHDPENIDDLSLTELYQSGDKTQPPGELDQAILALAAKKPDTPVWRRWSGPLASAAVVVLTVGVFLSQTTTAPFSAERQPLESELQPHSKSVSSSESAASAAASAAEARDQAAPRLQMGAESVSETDEALFADRPLAPAVGPAPPPATLTEAPGPSRSLDAAPMAKLSAIEEAATAQSARRERVIEEIIVTASMHTAEDNSAVYTASDCTSDTPDANPCEIEIEHPQCSAGYTLSHAVTDLEVRERWVDVYTSDSTLRMSCEDGEWVITPAPEQD